MRRAYSTVVEEETNPASGISVTWIWGFEAWQARTGKVLEHAFTE